MTSESEAGTGRRRTPDAEASPTRPPRRDRPGSIGDGAADRVRRSHAQTRTTLRFALAFFAAAAVAAAAEVVRSGDSWLPLHLFLAGGVVLAISAVSLMLTVTWSAAPAPADRWVAVQRGAITVGAAGIAVGRTAPLPTAVVGVAGALYISGLALLAGLLVVTIRRGPKRRFDVAVAAYLAALTAGGVGAVLGLTMALTSPTTLLRTAHATANLYGLVGLTIGGTLPFFASTVGRSRMAGRATNHRLAITLGWQTTMVALAVSTLATAHTSAAALAFAGYSAGPVATLIWMPPPTRRQLQWSGPRLVGLWAGVAWWVLVTVITGCGAATGSDILSGRWLLVLLVAGYGQVVWGSLAYLLPMLRGGGHELLSDGFATTRSWLGLAAVNAAGVALAASWTPVAIGAVFVWVLDSATRAARVGTSRAPRPTEE